MFQAVSLASTKQNHKYIILTGETLADAKKAAQAQQPAQKV